jgi:transposase
MFLDWSDPGKSPTHASGEVMRKRGIEGTVAIAAIDLAKTVFGVHGVDERGQVVLRKRLRRHLLLEEFASRPPCLIGMEACSGAHYWARELVRFGHTVRLMAAESVKTFRNSQQAKGDEADAEAICTAVSQTSRRFVAVKSVEQQAALVPHRIRKGFLEERTATINRLRGLLSEFGVVLPKSPERLRKGLEPWLAQENEYLPGSMKASAREMLEHVDLLEARIERYQRLIDQHAKASEPARRVMALTGVGAITADAAVATVTDPAMFKNGRQFAAWLGLTPKLRSSGQKVFLGRITRCGDAYLRTLLVQGARSALQSALKRPADQHNRLSQWIAQLHDRVGYHKTLVAIANKHARIVWAMLAKGENFNPVLPSAG